MEIELFEEFVRLISTQAMLDLFVQGLLEVFSRRHHPTLGMMDDFEDSASQKSASERMPSVTLTCDVPRAKDELRDDDAGKHILDSPACVSQDV